MDPWDFDSLSDEEKADPCWNESLSDEEWYNSLNEEERRILDGPIEEALGIKVEYEPDSESPPINYQALRAFDRGELDDESIRNVIRLIAAYRPWRTAWGNVRRHEFLRQSKGWDTLGRG